MTLRLMFHATGPEQKVPGRNSRGTLPQNGNFAGSNFCFRSLRVTPIFPSTCGSEAEGDECHAQAQEFSILVHRYGILPARIGASTLPICRDGLTGRMRYLVLGSP